MAVWHRRWKLEEGAPIRRLEGKKNSTTVVTTANNVIVQGTIIVHLIHPQFLDFSF